MPPGWGFALALLFGALGIFGGVAASVAERIREIGFRLALGAVRTDPAAVLRQE